MPVRTAKRRSSKKSEQGYVLITLIFMIAVLIIIAAVAAPKIEFQAKRDREEEMIHRGVQYSRAIRAFVKKVGRYPTRLEELDNTNQIKFLRRHYKDPITGKDFRLLHQGEVQISFGAGIAGAAQLGANTLQGAQAVQQQAAGQIAQGLAAANGGFGNTGGSSFNGLNASNSSSSNSNSDQNGTPQNGQPGAPDANAATGDNSNNGQPGQNAANGNSNSNNGPNGQVFGGGAIVGVASTSKAKSIRIFNKKEHYNEWQFIYDPSTDRGGL
ncbi:MAG TPA: type II secretion system protein, partial [Verrucomicrobiae bacterium]|nr:type II secretion system protein [Verrucomicrobiae bacterium]